MKRFVGIIYILVLGLLASCAPGTTAQTEQLPELELYAGPKAKLVLGEFNCEARNCYTGVGRGIADAMVTTMVLSDRFVVVEAASNLGVLTAELNVTNAESAFQGADIAVIGNIIQFEPNASGSSGGGGVGNLFGLGTAIGLGQRTATATIDIRVVNIKTREIITASRITGEATSTSLSGRARIFGLSGGLGEYTNTPMEIALQKMVINAVNDLGNKIPRDYFKY